MKFYQRIKESFRSSRINRSALGLVLSLSIVFAAFEYKVTYEIPDFEVEPIEFPEPWEYPPITTQEAKTKEVEKKQPDPDPNNGFDLKDDEDPITEPTTAKKDKRDDDDDYEDYFGEDNSANGEDYPDYRPPVRYTSIMPRLTECSDEANTSEQWDCTRNMINKLLMREAEYPEMLKEAGIEGTVLLSFVINEKGKVKDIKILKSEHNQFSKEVKRAVASLPDFLPASDGVRPVSILYEMPFRFRLR